MAIDDRGWQSQGRFRRGQVERILADPKGWDELSGPSWLGGAA